MEVDVTEPLVDVDVDVDEPLGDDGELGPVGPAGAEDVVAVVVTESVAEGDEVPPLLVAVTLNR